MEERTLMNRPEMKLQIDTIKRVFSALDHDEKVALIRDLMDEAKIDSIVHNNRPVFVNDFAINNQDYRSEFTAFMSPFLCSFLIVIEQEYIDQCFEIYKILQERSIGSRYESQCDVGDQFLYSDIGDYHEDLHQLADDAELFKNDIEKDRIFTQRIFINSDINLVQIICFRQEGLPINIRLIDLFILLKNNYDHAYIVLLLFGYLSTKQQKETYDKYVGMLLELFPEHSTVEEIITNQKVKLSSIFSLKFI